MKILDRLFGPRLDPDDDAVDPAERDRQIEDLAVKHEATLRTVKAVLSDSQQRVAVAIDETADLIERQNRRRRR